MVSRNSAWSVKDARRSYGMRRFLAAATVAALLLIALPVALPLATARAADDRPLAELRLVLGADAAPREVRDDFSSDGSSALPDGDYTTALTRRRLKDGRFEFVGGMLGARGGVIWSLGGAWTSMRIEPDQTPADPAYRNLGFDTAGAFFSVGYALPLAHETLLEIAPLFGLGIARASWVSPDTSGGAVRGEGSGDLIEEGVRLGVNTRVAHHLLLGAEIGYLARQSKIDIDYGNGQNSRLTLDSHGVHAAVVVGYAF